MSTRYNTGNPIESTDVRDMSDNAKNFDNLVNSADLTFTDRFGVERLTIEGFIKQYGINPASFNFQTGGTLNIGDNNRAVLWPVAYGGDGDYYIWKGEYPKVVPAGSSPSASGGVSNSGWMPLGDITLRSDLASSNGVDLIGYQSGMTLADLIATEPSVVTPYITLSTTHLDGFQNAINAGSVRVPSGSNLVLDGSIDIPANRLIIVDFGATVTSSGRFTAYGVNNVHWVINGSVLGVGTTTAPAKSGWPNTAQGTQLGDERGFIEFGGVTFRGNDGDNYSVRIGPTGVVAGDWVGTPNFTDQVRQVNRKGIAAWNCSNVHFESDGEIYGFEGEAVYWCSHSAAGKNVYMRAKNLHDCRFNGLNVNAILATENIKIEKSVTKNTYHGVEASTGVVLDCRDYSSVKHAVYAGQGHGGDGRRISGNLSFDCQGVPFAIVYNKAYESLGLVKDVVFTDNHAVHPATGFIAIADIENIQAHGNTCSGLKAGRFLQVTGCQGGSLTGNTNCKPAVGTEHYYEAECYSLFKENNKKVSLGGSYNVLMKANDDFTGGLNSNMKTHGNRENFVDARATNPDIATGPEYRFSYDQTLPFVAATISSNLVAYDANGAKGDICFNNLKINNSDTLGTSWVIRSAGHLEPDLDAFSNVGSPSKRCNVVYSAGGVQTTSDANKKTDVADLTEKEKSLASELKGLIRTYRLIGSDKKSFGVIAQSVCEAFDRNGLDWRVYDVVHLDDCDDGNNIYSIKYEQLLALIVSAT